MRSFLLFLLVFALGLGVLLWVESRGGDGPSAPDAIRPASDPGAPRASVPEPLDGATRSLPEGPLEPDPADPGPVDSDPKPADGAPGGPTEPVTELATPLPEGGQVRVGGETSIVRYDRPGGTLLYRVHAGDVRSLSPESYELDGVSMEFHDEDSGELWATVEAASARIRARFTESGFELDEAEPIVLEEVDAVLHSGSPVVPLTTHLPYMHLWVNERQLHSDVEVAIEGRGLDITGEGFELDARAETLAIRRNPHAELRFEDGTEAELAAEGELTVTSSGAQERSVELTAARAAVLDFTTVNVARLAADRIRIAGSVGSAADGAEPDGDGSRFVPGTVEGSGAAVFTTWDGDGNESTYRGERGQLLFDAGGAPERARLEGSPRLALGLSAGDLGELAPEGTEPGAERLPVEAFGAGPLEVGLGPLEVLTFGGPVEVGLPTIETRVRAVKGLSGSRDRERGRMALSIRGEVEVEHGAARMEAPELVIDAAVDAGGRSSGRLASAGPTRTVGVLAATTDERPEGERERPFELTTTGSLLVTRDEDGFRVPRAVGVELTVGGEEPFAARADLVRDFREEPLAFRAEGHVRFDSGKAQASGDTLVVDHGSRAVLTGGAGLARVDFDRGWLEAPVVELVGDELRAREGARAELEADGRHHALSANWVRLDRDARIEDRGLAGVVVLDALGEVVLSVEDERGVSAEITADVARILAAPEARKGGGPGEQADEDGSLEPLELEAEGNVRFGYEAELFLSGSGRRLVLRADGSGELQPHPDREVEVQGRLADGETDFELRAAGLDFSPARLIAVDTDVTFQGVELGGTDTQDGRLRVVAGRMSSDRTSVLLTGGAHLSRREPGETGWYLYADKVDLRAARDGEPTALEDEGIPAGGLGELLAWDGFVAAFGDDVQVSGESLQLARQQAKVTIKGAPAIVELPSFQWASTWFELDLETTVVRAGPGEVRGAEATKDSWRLSYTSIEPIEHPEETIQVIREPVIQSRNEEVTASWALIWVDNSEWMRMSQKAVGRDVEPTVPLPEPSGRRPPHPDSLFGRIGASEGLRGLREVYLEGNVSYSKRGRRVARADSIYLDMVDGHGWIRRIDFGIELAFLDERELRLRARWMRHSADGSFVASNAVATTCEHEEPHYVVRIGDLEIEPRERRSTDDDDEKLFDGWQISTRNTSVRLYDKLEIPLPRIAVPVTPDLDVDTEQLSLGGLRPLQFGSDSKLGTFIGTTVSRELGWLAKGVHRLLAGARAPSLELSGQTDYRASWNDDRGLLLGLESELEAEGRYDLTIGIDGLFDRGDDEGLIRVRDGESTDWRAWYRARGRYIVDSDEWVDLVASYEEDAAVQSEFFESEFIEFEERETYLHWRKANGPDYKAATVEAYPNDFRTEIVGQEALHARGRTSVAGLSEDVPVVYSSSTSLAHLAREIGDPRAPNPFGPPTSPLYPSPFDPRFVWTDGWGEQDTVRFDTRHRLETPLDLGHAGLRATPFLEARGTAWSIDSDQNQNVGGVLTSAEDPTRLGLLGGIELGTTIWRRFGDSLRHVLSPFIGFRQDLFVDEDRDPLVRFDQVEDPLDGRYFDLGLRSHLGDRGRNDYLDVELVGTYADEAPGQVDSRWLPIEVNLGFLTELWGMGFGVLHDARYDLELDETPYSRTVLGLDPVPDLGIEVGYHSARDLSGSTLYNAFSTGANYAFSDKWELEGRYVFSTLGDGRLSSEFAVRRIGHDFVFELSTRFREGEGGGTSFQFDVIPLLGYDETGLSRVERWRARRY